MSDGRIVISTELDTSGAEKDTEKLKKSINDTGKEFSNSAKESQKLEQEMKKLSQVLGGEVPEATKTAYSNIAKMNQEISSVSRQFGSHSQEAIKAKNALNEYALGLDDVTFKQVYMKSQLGLTDAQLNQQANSIKLNARMVSLMGSQTQILTQRMQGLKEHGVKPSDLLPASTIGQFKMLSETVAASESPIYRLSAGYRTLGASMEKTIKGWSAQKIAVKMAGDDMVKYGLILRGITAGQANLALAFPIVGIMAVAAYAKIFSSAIQANEGLQKLSETAKGKLGQAFKPLLDVAGMVAKAFLDMTIKVADLMTKFNETYPILSKVVASIALLAPVMTLLLLPLNMGIGLFGGLGVAINQAWVAISGVVGAIGLATSTFLAIGAVIGAVAWSFMYLLKTNETFRNAVIPIWEAISSAASKVFSGIGDLISKGFVATIEGAKKALNGMVELFLVTLPNAFKQGGLEGLITTIGDLFINLGKNIYSGLSNVASVGVEFVKSVISGIQANLPKFLATGSQIVSSVIQGINQALSTIITIGFPIVTNIINAIVTNLPQLLAVGSQIITNLIQGISMALPQMIAKMNETRMLILTTIASYLPQILNAGVQIVNMLIQGIAQALPVVMTIGAQIITSVLNAVVVSLPLLINTGVNVLMTFLNGIIQALPILVNGGMQIVLGLASAITQNLSQIIDSAMSIIDTIINTITELLPTIIDTGIEVLVSLIDGITNAIPQLVAMIPTIIEMVVTVITENLPKIIEAGSQILISVINGISKALPQLIAAVPQITASVVTTIIENLPQIIEAGIKIIVALASGLIQAIPQLVAAIPQIISAVREAFTSVDWGSIGLNIMKGIAAGIKGAVGSVMASARNAANDIKESMKDALGIHSPSRVFRDEVGKNIVLGIAEGIKRNTKNAVASIRVLSIAALGEGIAKADSYKELGQEYINSLKEGVENRQNLLIESFKQTVDKGVATFVSENKASESQYRAAGNNLVKAYMESIKKGTNEALTEITENITNISDEFQKAYDDIIKKRDDFQKELLEYGGLYSTDDNGNVQLNNIKKQTKALEEYALLLEALKSKGVSDNFLEQITGLDVETGTELAKKLLALGNKELQAYVQAWQTKQEVARLLAEQFYKNQLDTLDTKFNKKIDEAMQNVPVIMKNIGQNAMQGFMDGMDSQLANLLKKSSDIAESVLKTYQDAFDIHSPSRVFKNLIGANIVKGIGAGIEVETPTLISNIDSNISDLVSKLQSSVDYETARTTSKVATQSNYNANKGNTQSVINNDNGVTQNVTIVNPERTPSENARALKKVGRDLAFGY